jgi:hypothetical protein
MQRWPFDPAAIRTGVDARTRSWAGQIRTGLMLAAEADPDWPGVGTRVRLRERCFGKLSLPGGWDCVVMTGMGCRGARAAPGPKQGRQRSACSK